MVHTLAAKVYDLPAICFAIDRRLRGREAHFRSTSLTAIDIHAPVCGEHGPVSSATLWHPGRQLAANRRWSLASSGERPSRFIRLRTSPVDRLIPRHVETGAQIRFQGGCSAQNWIRYRFLTSNDRFDSMGFRPLPPYNSTKGGNSLSRCIYQSLPQRRAFLGRLVPSACLAHGNPYGYGTNRHSCGVHSARDNRGHMSDVDCAEEPGSF
jgi:hypothetical protein